MTPPPPHPLLAPLVAESLVGLLALGNLPWLPSGNASTAWSSGWPDSKPDSPTSPRTTPRRTTPDPPAADAFVRAVWREVVARQHALVTGIHALRHAPPPPPPPALPVVWSHPWATVREGSAGPGLPVLLVPSLVNRARILDLTSERSLVRHLAAAGLRPLLLEWRHPLPPAADLGTLIHGVLTTAVTALAARAGRPLALAGYCMGGLLALAAALAQPAAVSAFVALATPFDFHAGDGGRRGRFLAALAPLLARSPVLQDHVPPALLQTLFGMVDPPAVAARYRQFATTPPTPLAVALEHWLNDGVPLPGAVAAEVLREWYGANAPATGRWAPGGVSLRVERLGCRALVVAPRRDRLVPPASARALAAALPGAETLTPAAGHIGMMAGRNAPRHLYTPLAAWLRAE